MKNYKISVIICTYNRAEILRVALESLGRNQLFSMHEYEIIVVDDGSTDHTEDVVKDIGFVCDRQYYKIAHAGRAAARNWGIKEARGDYILFVDDDIIAPPDLLQEHYELHRKHPHSVVRGPIINVTEHRIPEGRAVSWRDYSSAFFCTCNASVNKFALAAIGGFDEDFTEYGFEDNEIGWRLREKGWHARFNPKAIVYHYKPALQKDQLAEMIQRAEELGRSAVAYYDKHPHWKVALATGLHPALRWWNRLLTNQKLYDYCLREWNIAPDQLTPGRRAFLEGRIFQYNYLRSLERERQRVDTAGPAVKAPTASDETPDPPADSTRVGPTIGETGRIVNKNIRPNVHVQPKKAPGEGPGRAL